MASEGCDTYDGPGHLKVAATVTRESRDRAHLWSFKTLSIRPEPEKLIVMSNSLLGQIEWTSTRMPDSRFVVEKPWCNE